MKKVFSIDSPLMQLISKYADLVILNVLYLVCCLPIITIGAARTALYATTLKQLKGEDAGILCFFRMFKENFKHSFLPWIILLVTGAGLAWSAYVTYVNRFPYAFIFWIALFLLLLIYILILSQIFTVCARFTCTPIQYFRNALLIALAHPLVSIVHIFLTALPWVIFYAQPGLFFNFLPIWLLVYFALQACIDMRLASKIYSALEDRLSSPPIDEP